MPNRFGLSFGHSTRLPKSLLVTIMNYCPVPKQNEPRRESLTKTAPLTVPRNVHMSSFRFVEELETHWGDVGIPASRNVTKPLMLQMGIGNFDSSHTPSVPIVIASDVSRAFGFENDTETAVCSALSLKLNRRQNSQMLCVHRDNI